MGKSRKTDQEFHFPQENRLQVEDDVYRERNTDLKIEFAVLDDALETDGSQDEKGSRRLNTRLAMTTAAAVTVVCVMQSSMGYDILGYDFLGHASTGGYQDVIPDDEDDNGKSMNNGNNKDGSEKTGKDSRDQNKEPSTESKTKGEKTTVTLRADPFTVTLPWEEAVNPDGKYREYTYYYVVEITFEAGKYPSAVFDTFQDAMQDTDDIQTTEDMYGQICSWLDANGFDSPKLTMDADDSETKYLGRETSENFMIVGDGDNLGAAWVISGSVTDRYEIHEKYVLVEE